MEAQRISRGNLEKEGVDHSQLSFRSAGLERMTSEWYLNTPIHLEIHCLGF